MSLLACCYRNNSVQRGVSNNDATVDDDLIGIRVVSVDHVLLVIADKRKY
jgi:hypothetical protein